MNVPFALFVLAAVLSASDRGPAAAAVYPPLDSAFDIARSETQDIVYFLSLIFLPLYLTRAVFEFRKWR